MTSHTNDTATRDDDVEARERHIRNRILDGIEETLDDLAQPRVLRAEIARQVERVVQARCAVLLCRQALCRRAKRCRSQPCKVPALDFQRSE